MISKISCCFFLKFISDDMAELLLGESKLEQFLKENALKQSSSPRGPRPKLTEVRKHLTAALDRGNLKVSWSELEIDWVMLLSIEKNIENSSFLFYCYSHHWCCAILCLFLSSWIFVHISSLPSFIRRTGKFSMTSWRLTWRTCRLFCGSFTWSA